MNKKKIHKEKVISLLRARLERSEDPEISAEERISDQELEVLLGELQIFQLELEMQNDELSASYQMLENERSKFAGFFNLAPVGYFILDHLGMVEEANQTGADMLDISKSSVLQKRFQSFIAPEHWEIFYGFLHRMQSKDSKQSSEILISLNGGQELYTRMEGIAVSDIFTGKSKYYVTVIDISESRNAQQKLIETSQRLEMTLTASGTGTWTMELGNNKVFLDAFSYSILELNSWEFDGTIKGLIALIHPNDQERVRHKLLNMINTFTDLDLEFRIVTKSGKVKNISAKGHEVKNETMHNYFAGIIMDITERKRLAREAEALEKEKQKLVLSATFNAQEKERYKISSALHDSVCQILYGIRLNLQNIQLTKNLRGEFTNVNKLLDQAIRETRELSYELTPSVLRDFGFNAGVREMAQRLSTPQFRIKTVINSAADLLRSEVQLYVFRMIQELINNCIKHANATEAEIKICTENEMITLVISDNGTGFDKEVEKSLSQGSGIRGIKNRIFLLNGKMDLQTSAKGTSITIEFRSDPELSELSGY
ncbi:PAS domain S-box-containing protein [Pedobacter steynii]|uniref:histidine kinase n=1 Tax=Pedobacter steynii TaxID=430522 RepID=A0A1G9SDU1_9SPHI|nr:PAS domain S-box protein [Pedobacter steynii]NQX37452.1 PAS domain S-box protein [Pedobacter steynii]SDM33609.1 PAS domain S-box-containing protein [Pedobacter steynii]